MKVTKAIFALNCIQVWALCEKDDGGYDEMCIKSSDMPSDTFIASLKKSRQHFLEFSELPGELEENISIVGIKFDHLEDEIGVRMRAVRSMERSLSMMSLSCPVKWTGGVLSNDDDGMSENARVEMYFLHRELDLFVKGKRAQLNLFDATAQETGHKLILSEHQSIHQKELIPNRTQESKLNLSLA